jgi:hypothetical protein
MLKPFYVLSLAAAISAAFLTHPASAADVPPFEQAAICHYNAAVYARQFEVMTPRLKTPLFAAVGFLVAGWPGAAVMGVLGANAESPMERRQFDAFYLWCMGMTDEIPRGMR